MIAFHAASIVLALIAQSPQAPPQRPRAELSAINPAVAVTRGSQVTVSVRVRLPDGVHVQADKPRDPALVATQLTVSAPAGVTVDRVVYPAPSEFVQNGQGTPLLVFGHDFVVEVTLTVSRSAAAGDLHVPLQLRYQACNDRLCFAPARATAEWVITCK